MDRHLINLNLSTPHEVFNTSVIVTVFRKSLIDTFVYSHHQKFPYIALFAWAVDLSYKKQNSFHNKSFKKKKKQTREIQTEATV